jgi:hypothetical protein
MGGGLSKDNAKKINDVFAKMHADNTAIFELSMLIYI